MKDNKNKNVSKITLYKLDKDTYRSIITSFFDSLFKNYTMESYMYYDEVKKRWCVRYNGETILFIKIFNNVIQNIYLNQKNNKYNIYKDTLNIELFNKFINNEIIIKN